MGGFGRVHPLRRLVAVDLTAVAAAWLVAYGIGGEQTSSSAGPLLGALLAVIATTMLGLRVQRLYQSRVAMIRSEEVARIARVTCVSAVVVAVGARAVGVQIGSTLVVTGVLGTFLLLTYARGRYQAWISGQRSIGNFGRRVVIVGDPDEASWLVDLLQDSPELGYVAVGFTGPLDPDRVGPNVPWLGSFDDVESAVATTGASGVVISATSMSSAALTGLVRRLHQKQIHVLLASGITGMHRRRLRVQPVGYQPLIYVEAESLSQLQLAAKRVLDVVGATIGLIASAPLLLGAAIAIKAV